jgi:hypothetical protein
MEKVESHASFDGRQEVWTHASAVLGCEMRAAALGLDALPVREQGS